MSDLPVIVCYSATDPVGPQPPRRYWVAHWLSGRPGGATGRTRAEACGRLARMWEVAGRCPSVVARLPGRLACRKGLFWAGDVARRAVAILRASGKAADAYCGGGWWEIGACPTTRAELEEAVAQAESDLAGPPRPDESEPPPAADVS